jgi:hypothetical protein
MLNEGIASIQEFVTKMSVFLTIMSVFVIKVVDVKYEVWNYGFGATL